MLRSDFTPVKYDRIVFIENNVPLTKSELEGFGFWFFFEFVLQNLRSNFTCSSLCFNFAPEFFCFYIEILILGFWVFFGFLSSLNCKGRVSSEFSHSPVWFFKSSVAVDFNHFCCALRMAILALFHWQEKVLKIYSVPDDVISSSKQQASALSRVQKETWHIVLEVEWAWMNHWGPIIQHWSASYQNSPKPLKN